MVNLLRQLFKLQASEWGCLRTLFAFWLLFIALACSFPWLDFLQHPGNYGVQSEGSSGFGIVVLLIWIVCLGIWGSIGFDILAKGVNMNWQDLLTQLIKTPALWVALMGLYRVLLTTFVPTFPPAVIDAIDRLVLVIASAITGVIVAQVAYTRLLATKK